jgi:amino acid transporter
LIERSDASNKGLKAGAIGTWGVAALGAGMMAPVLGIYANLPLVSAGSGKAAPAVFLIALILTLPTAISYALIAREVPSAGSAYTWLSEAVHPGVGLWTGLLLVATYFFAVVLQPILFGLFFNDLLALFNFQTGFATWMVAVLFSTAIVIFLAYPGIEISSKSSLAVTVFGLVIVSALSFTILIFFYHRGQIHFTPFDPRESLNGARGLFKGLIFGLLSFVGFSVITTAAEETHSPRSIIPRVVVGACVLLGVFWAVCSWGFSLALPEGAWAEYVAKGINPVDVLARQYWHAGSVVVIVTALVAVLGVYLGAIVGCARVAYAMGRDGTLPAFLGRLHPKYRVPWNAQHIVLIVTLVIAGVWGRWLGLYLSYDWWGSTLVFFAMVSNILVNIGFGLFFYRFRRAQFRWYWHGIIPFIGLVTSALPLFYSFGADMWDAGWKRGQSVIVFCGFITIVSALYSIVLGLAKPEVLGNSSALSSPENNR